MPRIRINKKGRSKRRPFFHSSFLNYNLLKYGPSFSKIDFIPSWPFLENIAFEISSTSLSALCSAKYEPDHAK
ncbi:hypothetical protein LEP1GSC079_0298, partial [Leptospira interrogans str. FPW1039]